MTGPEPVDERRPPAFATGPKRDPGAHHAGADDDEVGAATRRRAAGAVNNTYFRFSSAYPDPTDPDYLPVGIDHVFDMTNMPSYRLTIDMRDLDGARLIITTGQSGNPFDRHYNDQIGPWIGGETVPLPFTTAAISAAAASTLTLTP